MPLCERNERGAGLRRGSGHRGLNGHAWRPRNEHVHGISIYRSKQTPDVFYRGRVCNGAELIQHRTRPRYCRLGARREERQQQQGEYGQELYQEPARAGYVGVDLVMPRNHCNDFRVGKR